MIGEEGHPRIQVMQAGLELDRAYRTADELDTALIAACISPSTTGSAT